MNDLLQHLKNQMSGEQKILEKEQMKAVLTAEGFMEQMIDANRFLSKTETAKIGFKKGDLKLRTFELTAHNKDSRSKLEEIAELVAMTAQRLAEEYRKMYVRQCIRLEKQREEKLNNLMTFNRGVMDGNASSFSFSFFGLFDFSVATYVDKETGKAIVAFGFGKPEELLANMQKKEIIQKFNKRIHDHNKAVKKAKRLEAKKDEITMDF